MAELRAICRVLVSVPDIIGHKRIANRSKGALASDATIPHAHAHHATMALRNAVLADPGVGYGGVVLED